MLVSGEHRCPLGYLLVILVNYCDCTGLFVSVLVEIPEDIFSFVEAQLNLFNIVYSIHILCMLFSSFVVFHLSMFSPKLEK